MMGMGMGNMRARGFRWTMAAGLIALPAAALAAEPLTLASPDGRIAVEVSTNEANQPSYSVRFKGRPVVVPSTLGLGFEQYKQLGAGMAITASERRSGEDRYRLVAGKTAEARDRYNEVTVRLAETDGEQRRLDIVFRAYDDGVAFRYRVPEQPNLRQLRLATELTEFNFPADYDCHALNLGRYTTSHEGEYDAVKASEFRALNLFELPVVCDLGNGGGTVGFAEADLRNYAGLYLAGNESGKIGLQARLSPRPDEPTVAVVANVTSEGFQSPWRVVMLGDTPGDLVESTLITSLNPAPAGDFGWVKPGKYAWDWWNGPVLSGVAKAGMNNETMRGFIDFAAENDLEYMLIDDAWYVNSGQGGTLLPGADNLRSIPEIDMPGLVRYAADKGVGTVVWVHWRMLDQNMDVALPLYAKWGIKGIKVDFMDRDDQPMVDFYHRLMKTAAANKLMVNLHGAYAPRGMVRTYPNFVTQEGVLGAEYNKWSKRITARHNVTIPFTRMVMGPMDYTPGGFRNFTPATFEPQNLNPGVMTTRGQALAMYVVYESPFQGVSDSPDNYRGQPGFDFVKMVPATWDETRVLSGKIGEHIVIARRKGRDWYVGAMTNEAGRTVSVPLSFLGSGRYEATIWQDGQAPTDVAKAARAVAKGETLNLVLAPSGGAAMKISPR